jgi:N-acetylglucosaminyldiphosphoundecaprenol N-acetyl-beta-D-mannosaminyltransferase
LGDIYVHQIDEAQTVRLILDELAAGRGGAVVTPNIDHLYRASNKSSFRALVHDFDLATADGMPLVWLSRLMGRKLPGRVPGSNLISSLTAGAAEEGRSVFFLGGDYGTAEGAANVLTQRHPNLKVAGHHYPERGFEDSTVRYSEMIDSLRESAPDIVYVALGSPKQEEVINNLRHTLPNAWWLGIGISFSFLTGDVGRAPAWMRNNGLEWLHRMAQDPKRLGKRYLLENIPYAFKLFARAGAARLAGRKPEEHVGRLEPVKEDGLGDVSTSPAVKPAHIGRNGESKTAWVPAPPPVNISSGLTEDYRHVLPKLREVILLAGQQLQSRLATTAGRPILELPLLVRPDDDAEQPGKIERLLDGWLRWNQDLATLAGFDKLPTRLVVSTNTDVLRPSVQAAPGGVSRAGHPLSLETDRSEHRGTGGLLHDLLEDAPEDDLVLVCTARQILIDPLTSIVRVLANRIASGADAAFVFHDDGTPAGITLMRCKLMHELRANGYIDLKQQALPKLSERFDIRAIRTKGVTGLPIFGLPSYIQAMDRYHARRSDYLEQPPLGVPGAEDFRCRFSIVEDGAHVDPSARLHNSVVLAGGRVEARASVVSSLVTPRGVVPRGQHMTWKTV